MVSNREDLQSDCKTVNAIVSALTVQSAMGGPSAGSSDESVEQQIGRRRSSASKINFMSSNSPTMSPPHGLPRPRSENNFATAAAAAAVTAAAIGVPSEPQPPLPRSQVGPGSHASKKTDSNKT